MDKFFTKSRRYLDAEQSFEHNRKQIHRLLTPEQRKLLLRMVDAHGLMLEQGTSAAAVEGFRLGARVVADAFR